MYRAWRGTSACQDPDDSDGGASSKRSAEPHFDTAHIGASRSVSPESARIARRLLDFKKLGEDSWYLSTKSDEGKVR